MAVKGLELCFTADDVTVKALVVVQGRVALCPAPQLMLVL